MNIGHSLDRAALYFPDRPAIHFEGRTITYGNLRAEVDRVAHGLAGLGVGAGDRVAIFLPNLPEFAIVYLAAQKVGAVAVSANVMLTTAELGYLVADSGSATLFTTEALFPRAAPLLDDPASPLGRVVICEGVVEGQPALAELGAGVAAPFRAREMEPSDPAVILYTSGTTGRQKGAVLSHLNVISNVNATQQLLRLEPSDSLILYLPLFHCFGQNFIMNSAFNAGASVVMQRRFDPAETLSAVERHGVTIFLGVPTIYLGLLNAGVPPERLASVRLYFSAAATLPVETGAQWRERFGRPINEGYGLTETSPFASYNHEHAHRPGSVGTPIPLVELRVVDAEGQALAPGEWGEIVIRGPNVMLGYWNRPAETAEALRGGWFHSGDIGYLDDDGYCYLVDRVKDMINTAGFKVWPREVEEVLYRHPAIHECAVVGVPEPAKGEIARAFVVMRPGASVTPDALAAFCRQELAAYKVPRAFEFVTELPKNPTGKILKRVLREQAATATRE